MKQKAKKAQQQDKDLLGYTDDYLNDVDKEAWPMPSYGDLIFEV